MADTPVAPSVAPASAQAPAEASPEAPPDLSHIFEPDAETPPPPAAGAPAEVVPPPEEKAKPLSPQFAALAKAEKALQKQRGELKQQQDAWEAEKAERSSAKELIVKGDYDAAMRKAFGLSYEEFVVAVANGKQPTPPAGMPPEAAARLEAAEKQVLAMQQQLAAEKNAAQHAQLRSDVGALTAKPEFELMAALEKQEPGSAYQLVLQQMQRHYNHPDTKGEVLMPEAAAAKVEAHLESWGSVALTAEKFKAKLPPAAPKPEARPPAAKAPQTPPRTLTQTQAAALPPRAALNSADRDELLANVANLKLFDDE